MDENLNVVDETQENVVDSQETEALETTEQTVDADNGEVTTPNVDKTPQSAEDNARFANYRRESEATANTNAQTKIDKHYEDLYGESNNVHSEAEYNAAVEAQEQSEAEEAQRKQYEDAGLNQELINQLINDNPAVKQANEVIAQQKETKRINSEVDDLFKAFPEARDAKIPDTVFQECIDSGIPLKYAYSMYANKNSATLAEQKTLRGIAQNAQTSPGALNGDQAEKSSYSNMSTKDFNELTDRVLRGEKINL
jgi:hypothetical protein